MDYSILERIGRGDFWQELWELSDSRRRKRTDDQEKTIAMWNKRACSFAKNTETNDSRRESVLQFLKDCGVELAGASILDVGAGPGNYALPMAREAKEVIALDPAAKMLDITKEKAEKEGLTNISYSSIPWEKADLDSLGWRSKFDLVFASVSPGIRDAATLKRMMDASRGYCYVSKFAGERKNNIQTAIQLKLFGEPRLNHSLDLFLPWNLLYAWGYYPNTRFIEDHWVNEEPIAKMGERMIDWFSHFHDLPDNYQEVIHKMLEEEAVNGLVREEVYTTFGLMVWKV